MTFGLKGATGAQAVQAKGLLYPQEMSDNSAANAVYAKSHGVSKVRVVCSFVHRPASRKR